MSKNYTIGLLLDNLILFLYRNFPSFIVNVSLLILLSIVGISIINNSLFNPPEHILDSIEIEKKYIEIEQKNIEDFKKHIEDIKKETPNVKPEPSDQISYDTSLKYQNNYEFHSDNPRLTIPKPGETLIYTLGQGGFMLSTVVPNNSKAIFENI